MISAPLAHSASGITPGQPYFQHVCRVTSLACEYAAAAAAHLPDAQRASFVAWVHNAAVLHDLGKLDPENQRVLMRPYRRARLPVNHVDAGVAKLKFDGLLHSAALVYAHHVGLPSFPQEYVAREEMFRDTQILAKTNVRLDDYLHLHRSAGCPLPTERLSLNDPVKTTLAWRIALSCLVDADHTDTATHYGNYPASAQPALAWEERLAQLDSYVCKKHASSTSPRKHLIHKIYTACRSRALSDKILACDSPVGTGKTTCVMAHLLRLAAHYNLRHIFVVLPYTNIIHQSVRVYRDALVLDAEDPSLIVAEHHHQVAFDENDLTLRHLYTHWHAPVIVTTAVQFFETLASNSPVKLRKLHQLPGSAVFIDEAHAAIPSWIWPQAWKWLNECAEHWNCYFVLTSATLARFWTLETFVKPTVRIPDLLPAELRSEAVSAESARVVFKSHPHPMTCAELIRFVTSCQGPRLVIMNTVQNAAVLARAMREQGLDVLHLSTALTPNDRERILDRVHRRLQVAQHNHWTLVATSCIEAGVDVSFRSVLRERCSCASLIQVGGRANRYAHDACAEVWDFCISDPLFNAHPAFYVSRQVLQELFDENLLTQFDPRIVTEAMRRELLRDTSRHADSLLSLEQRYDFPAVDELCKVISDNSILVLVDHDIRQRLERFDKVDTTLIIRNSVRIWSNKVLNLKLPTIHGHKDFLWWDYEYDPDFLGYMKGLLPILNMQNNVQIV